MNRAIKWAAIILAPLACLSSLGALIIVLAMFSPENFSPIVYVYDSLVILSGPIALVALAVFGKFRVALSLAALHFATLLVLNLI